METPAGKLNLPAKNLKDAFNACDPSAPLDDDDPRYVDLASGRGDEGNAVEQCRKRIIRSDRPCVQLFAGHRGCGKSTELRRLHKLLKQDNYFVVRFEVHRDLDLQDTEPADVLLALIRNLEEHLRKSPFQLSQKLLNDFEAWFGETILDTSESRQMEAAVSSEVRLGADVPLLAKLMARVTGQIRTGTESKKSVRLKLDPQVSQLVDRGKILVSNARSQIQQAGYKDLVMIVDNLDRVVPVSKGNARTSHDVLFIERGDLLKGFGCHTIITVPISLFFSPKGALLNNIFPYRHIVPMVKVATQDHQKWHPGYQLLEEVLGRRLDVDSLLEKDVAQRLIEMSGGHPRQLMNLMLFSMDFVDEPPVTLVAVEKAIKRFKTDYDRMIPENHWPLLAQVHLNQKVLNDEDHQLMLFNLSVLEYENDDRWCDVQPAIRELARFQAELGKTKKILT